VYRAWSDVEEKAFSINGKKGIRMSDDLKPFISEIIENVEKVIVGKREQIELMLVGMLSQGHILLEDVPGTGKTMLAHSMAVSMGIEFKRLQCTPDLLPTDITGVPVFLPHEGRFEFQPGPVFTNILLADEINRATPRTPSALLEAMQERRVTIGNTTHALSRPFLVLATQNPIEYEGTFPFARSATGSIYHAHIDGLSRVRRRTNGCPRSTSNAPH